VSAASSTCRAFARAGALAEDLEDEPGAVDDLALPGALEVALLHRRQGMVDDGKADRLGRDELAEGLDRAAADERPGLEPRQAHHLGVRHVELDRLGETHGFGQARLRAARFCRSLALAGAGAQQRHQDEGAHARRARRAPGPAADDVGQIRLLPFPSPARRAGSAPPA
jgi:hypothetical protein